MKLFRNGRAEKKRNENGKGVGSMENCIILLNEMNEEDCIINYKWIWMRPRMN